jgi:tRNA(Ile)-lysidine synthase
MKRFGGPLPETPALVAVSGGRDSVALLHWLVEAGSRELIIAHLDHGLRPESAEEARFVGRLGAKLGIEVVVDRVKLPKRPSVETAARQARYEFLARVAGERGIGHVLLAHHADDQVETFLFNLLRGASPAGLGAMRAVSTRVINGVTLQIHRPLLGVWREEIDAYVAQRGLDFCEDPSNMDRRHTRNRLRHEVLPMLAQAFGRDVRKAIWRTAEIFSAEREFLDGLLIPADTAPVLDVKVVRALPVALQRRVLHAWLRANRISNVAFDDVENLRALLEGPRAKVNLAGDRHARRRAGRLFLES